VRLLLPRIGAEYLLVDQGASTTGAYADAKASPSSLKIRKSTNRCCESARAVIGARLNLHPGSLAKLMVYSMAVDAPVRSEASPTPGERRFPSRQIGYLAGSKAMESLDKFITSTESFFHPSNFGLWSLSVRRNINFFFLRANHWLL
jgi:proteasome activator subunit 4